LFLSCGEQEGFLAPTRQLATLLAERHFEYEFHTRPGNHDWNQWTQWMPSLFQSLAQDLKDVEMSPK
jgi:enterochelin esterase-like enzyme